MYLYIFCYLGLFSRSWREPLW